LTFDFEYAKNYNNYFQAGIPVSNYSKVNEMQDLDSTDYCNGVNHDYNLECSNYTANFFQIMEIELKK